MDKKIRIVGLKSQIKNLKEARKSLSDFNKRMLIQIRENRKKRATQSSEIKSLYSQMKEVRAAFRKPKPISV